MVRQAADGFWGSGVRARAPGLPAPKYYKDGDHWSYTGGQYGDGREQRASEFACREAPPGDADAFVEAIDAFHARAWENQLIHVGPKKGAWLDAAVRARAPRVALEFGTQIGYSTIRIARCLPSGAHLWTIEPNPDNAALAESNLEHAGLRGSVTVLRGTFEDVWQRVPEVVDLVFLDHSRAAYLRELKGLERWGYVADGSVVVTDNIGGARHAKADEYAAYVRGSGRYSSAFHWGDDDGIEISEAVFAGGAPRVITPSWGVDVHQKQSPPIRCSQTTLHESPSSPPSDGCEQRVAVSANARNAHRRWTSGSGQSQVDGSITTPARKNDVTGGDVIGRSSDRQRWKPRLHGDD